MNVNLKIFAASAISFAVGYFVANKRNETFYFNQAHEEVELARSDFKEEIKNLIAEHDEKLADVQKQGIESNARVDEEIREASLIMKAYQGTGGFEPVDVHKHAAPIQYSDYVTAEETKPETQPEPKRKMVEVITGEQFNEGFGDYDNKTLNYHVKNDLMSDGELPGDVAVDVDTRAHIMGGYNDILQKEGIWGRDDTFYIRNHELGYDYEIIRTDGIYADESPGDNE